MTTREDAFSTNRWNLLSIFLCIEAMALLLTSPIVLAATWGITRHTLFAFAGVFVITLPFCLLLAWSHNLYVRKRSGFVELDDGTLHYYENENESPVYSAPLEDCLWFEGYRTWATLPRLDKVNVFQIVVGPQVILLQFPEWCYIPEHKSRKTTMAEQPVIIAVGQSREPREQWLTVLESMGIACDMTRHQRPLAPISNGLATCWFLLCGMVAFLKLPEAARGIISVLNHWNVPADVAEAIGFSVFFPGIVFLLLWMCVFPLLWISLRTNVGKVKVTWYELVISGAAILVFILGAIWFGMDAKTFDWKMTYTISTVVMCTVTFLCYCLNIRSPHPRRRP
ncbi:MAG: hypothetical protein FWH27_00285 [Planctomycetaceae bacterium]|nr:hypothetical protein [Planctomycetaceae bacterium]